MAVVISDQLLDRSDRLLDAEPDEHLVGLAQSGHDAAFAAIVRRYERELLAQARRLSSDGRGEDAVQQAFLNAFAALRAGSEVRHLRGWLHQILRNVVIRGRVPADVALEAASACGEPLEETVQRRVLAYATLAELSALPDRQRDALLGMAVMGLPRAQVAQQMGLSEGAVRQLVHRARLRLRQAATALVPFPLGRFFAGASATGSDAALGAGAAASGGLAVKVGTLVASGVVATGLAVSQGLTSQHRAGAAPGARHHATHPQRPQELGETPALWSRALSASSTDAVIVHAGATRPAGVRSAGVSGRLHDIGESHRDRRPRRGSDPGRGHGSGMPGAQGSVQAGRGQDGGGRGSTGADGGSEGGGGSSSDHGGRSGSGTASHNSGSTSPSGSSGSGGDGSRSGRDSGGSGDGSLVSTSGSGQSAVPTVTGAVASGSGSDGSSVGTDGSSGGSTSSGSSGSTSSGSSGSTSSGSSASTSSGSGDG